MKLFLTLLVYALLSFNNAYAVNDDSAVLKKFTTALQANDYPQARQYVSVASNSLFDRYLKYNLGSMTPQYGRVISQSSTAQFRYLKVASTNAQGKEKATNVAFVTENNAPKIDLPETLRLGFGPNWQQRVDMIEQSYNFAKQQFGDQQSQQLLNNMLQKK